MSIKNKIEDLIVLYSTVAVETREYQDRIYSILDQTNDSVLSAERIDGLMVVWDKYRAYVGGNLSGDNGVLVRVAERKRQDHALIDGFLAPFKKNKHTLDETKARKASRAQGDEARRYVLSAKAWHKVETPGYEFDPEFSK